LLYVKIKIILCLQYAISSSLRLLLCVLCLVRWYNSNPVVAPVAAAYMTEKS